jgi:hypothetical protein
MPKKIAYIEFTKQELEELYNLLEPKLYYYDGDWDEGLKFYDTLYKKLIKLKATRRYRKPRKA